MNRLKSFYRTTIKLHRLLNQTIREGNQEDKLARINILVEKRSHLLSQVSPPFTEEEQKMMKELKSINMDIQSNLNKALEREYASNACKKPKSSTSQMKNNSQCMFVYR